MSDRGVKIFLTVVGLYFITKDVGAVVMYSKRKTRDVESKKVTNVMPSSGNR